MDDTITKDIQIDEKIEDTVRRIQQQVMRFYEDYKSLHGIVQRSEEVTVDLKKLNECSIRLKSIRNICENELKGLTKYVPSSEIEKSLLPTIVTDTTQMVSDLREYITDIDWIVSWEGTLDTAQTKNRIDKTMGELQLKYEDFIVKMSDALGKLAQISNIAA